MDELYNNKLLNELSLMLGDSQKSQSPSMAQPTNNLSIAPTLDLISSLNENNSAPTSSGLASMEQPVEEEQISESIVETPNETPVSEGGLSQMVQQPKRSEFEITPEMRQISMAIDFLTGSPYGTTMKQISDDYRNITMAQEDRAIGDFERERAYQDTRADKAKAEEKAERAYRDAREKERRDYIDKKLEKLQGPAFRATTETAKANVANEARNLDPEGFAGKSDEEILERLRLGVEPSKKSGKNYDKEAELEALKHQFRMEEIAQKAANKPTKSDEGLDYATKQEITQEARGIREEKTNLTKEKKSIDTAQIDYDKKMSKLKGFKSQIDQIKKDIKSASTQLGYSSWFAPIAGEKASKSLANLKNIAADLNAAMTELVRASGATATMMNSDVEGKRYLGILANTDWGRKENEDVVKEALLGTIQRYEKGINLYKQELTERRKNLKDDKQNLAQREADYKQYKSNQNKTPSVTTIGRFKIKPVTK